MGKDHLIADTLSRSPVAHAPATEDKELAYILAVRLLPQARIAGFVDACEVPPYNKWLADFLAGRHRKKGDLKSVWALLSLVGGFLVVDGHRLVVPPQVN